jgi:drug/metabolite transporter (DMT)-like permease
MSAQAHALRNGLLLGLLGVVIFALTLPLTRLAVGTPEAPQLSGIFVSSGRATVAGLLSIVFLWATRAPRPQRANWLPLGVVTLGVGLGFPMFSSIAMRHVEAVHASVLLGVLPLATAWVGAWLHRQRPSFGFWLCASLGTSLVVAFAVMRSGQNGLTLAVADVLLLLAMACAAVGYGVGGLLSQRMRADHVICWALIIGLPINMPLALMNYPQAAIHLEAWIGFFYVAIFSQWLGFFAWYRGLALGGTVRVSQMQLLQPFMSMLFAMPILGESLDALTLSFGLAVIAVVAIGRNMPVRDAHTPSSSISQSKTTAA